MSVRRNLLLIVFLLLAACTAAPATQAPSQPPAKPAPTRTSAPAATQAPAAAPAAEINVEAADYSYAAPETAAAGWVPVTLTNNGKEPHHVQFLRLNDGVTMAQFQEALKQGEGPALALVKQMGGVGAVAPGLSASAVLKLTAGNYVILCFVPAPDKAPHFAHGMILPMTVVDTGSSPAGEPKANVDVTLKDYAFNLPPALPAGETVFKVTNEGPEPHEFNLLRLAEGKSKEDVLKWLETPDGPPPFMPVGGMNGLEPGSTGYANYKFEPGNYAAICNIPSPKAQGHPHFALGMIQQFAVAAPAAGAFPTGKFVKDTDKGIAYAFSPDGTFNFFFAQKDPVLTGEYSVTGNLLTINVPEEKDPDCTAPVTYQWAFAAGKLSFAPTGPDSCKPRSESFADTYVPEQ